MTPIGEVRRQADEADVKLVRLVFVNNSGVPRGRVVVDTVDALEDDDVLREAMGDALFESYVEVERSEWEQSTDDEGEWESDYLARGF